MRPPATTLEAKLTLKILLYTRIMIASFFARKTRLVWCESTWWAGRHWACAFALPPPKTEFVRQTLRKGFLNTQITYRKPQNSSAARILMKIRSVNDLSLSPNTALKGHLSSAYTRNKPAALHQSTSELSLKLFCCLNTLPFRRSSSSTLRAKT